MEKKIEKRRYESLDYVKGIAVIMMVFFHLMFDLDTFDFINIELTKSLFWTMQPKIIITIFLVSTGASLCLSHVEKMIWHKFWKRFLKLLLLAIGVTVITYFIFPKNWVYFGILHNIAISSLLALPFLKFPKISLVLGLALIFPSAVYDYTYPFIRMEQKSVDHVALFPWFGLVLIGIYLFHQGFHKIKIPMHKGKSHLLLLGRYSLEIYVLHQGVIFSVVYLLHKILK